MKNIKLIKMVFVALIGLNFFGSVQAMHELKWKFDDSEWVKRCVESAQREGILVDWLLEYNVVFGTRLHQLVANPCNVDILGKILAWVKSNDQCKRLFEASDFFGLTVLDAARAIQGNDAIVEMLTKATPKTPKKYCDPMQERVDP